MINSILIEVPNKNSTIPLRKFAVDQSQSLSITSNNDWLVSPASGKHCRTARCTHGSARDARMHRREAPDSLHRRTNTALQLLPITLSTCTIYNRDMRHDQFAPPQSSLSLLRRRCGCGLFKLVLYLRYQREFKILRLYDITFSKIEFFFCILRPV